jgi:hypothetical protein
VFDLREAQKLSMRKCGVNTPTITVVIPAFNAESYILETLESVLGQAGSESVEVIVVDDASSDRTLQLVRTIADTRLRIETIDRNSGPANSRNVGIEHARGTYVAFLDADDSLAPNYFSVINGQIGGGADMISFDFSRVDAAKQKISSTGHRRWPAGNVKSSEIHHALTQPENLELTWYSWRYLYKATFLASELLRFPPIRIGEDSTFNYRALLAASSMTHVDVPLYNYQMTAGSLTSAGYKSHLPEAIEVAYLTKKGRKPDSVSAAHLESLQLHLLEHQLPMLFGNASLSPHWRRSVRDVIRLVSVQASVQGIHLNDPRLSHRARLLQALTLMKFDVALLALYGVRRGFRRR